MQSTEQLSNWAGCIRSGASSCNCSQNKDQPKDRTSSVMSSRFVKRSCFNWLLILVNVLHFVITLKGLCTHLNEFCVTSSPDLILLHAEEQRCFWLHLQSKCKVWMSWRSAGHIALWATFQRMLSMNYREQASNCERHLCSANLHASFHYSMICTLSLSSVFLEGVLLNPR